MNKLYYNSLLIICFISFYGAAIYYFYRLNYLGIFLTLILSILTLILLNKGYKVKSQKLESQKSENSYTNILLLISYLLLLIFNFLILFKSSTSESIISPWQAVPWYFFLTYALTTIILIIVILNQKSKILNLPLISLHFFLSASVALIVYAVGYGFDPFIHQATEKLITAQGFVDPKPFYYLGQYALVVILHKLTFISIIWLDKLLVPVLAAIFLPPALFHAVKSFNASTKIALLSVLFMLIFPFSTFILTTPQNLANLFLILIILISLATYNLQLTSALALASAAVHPIAGIPALLFTAMLWGKKLIKNKKLIACYLLFVACAAVIALPAAFYLNNKTSAIINSGTAAESSPLFHMPKFFFSGRENFLLNFVYLYGFNINFIIILFIISGIFIYRKKIFNIQYSIFNIQLLMSISLLISYFITKTISFNYLIDYEQSAFPDRILQIAVFFTLPFILLALSRLVSTILKQDKIIKYSLFCFFVFLISCSLYHSYPRYDNYYNSRSYSASQSDIDAVRWIEENAKSDNFIVLANQQVSAAALREFGFKKYYTISPDISQEESRGGVKIFYYPIPTGDALYQYYLKMVYEKADKKTALEAANLVGADTVYFVLNDYWWAYDKILAEAKLETDEIKNINNEIYIFKYEN
ncbi:MAG: hypothetical protein WC323_02755 [Patescibacteria group bacterium]|jgi:hypothetical protein